MLDNHRSFQLDKKNKKLCIFNKLKIPDKKLKKKELKKRLGKFSNKFKLLGKTKQIKGNIFMKK